MKINLRSQIAELKLAIDPEGLATIGVRPATENDNIEI